MTKRKTGGGVGTNQYQVKGYRKSQSLPILASDPVYLSLPMTAQRLKTGIKAGTISPGSYVSHHDKTVRWAIAASRQIRTVDCDALLKGSDVETQRILAANPRCPEKFLLLLSDSPHFWIREEVAANRSCPIALFPALVIDLDEDVRVAAARNRKTPPQYLDRWRQTEATQ